MPTSSKARIAWIVLGALLLAGGAGVWRGRDLPRRWVEILLAEQLGATVELDRLTFEARDRFLLQGLRIGPSRVIPPLAAANVESLRVRGSLTKMLEGDFSSIEVDGAVVRLRPAALPPSKNPPQFHRVDLENVQVYFEGASEKPGEPIRLRGSLREVGGAAMSAELSFHGKRVDLPQLAAVATLGAWKPPPNLEGSLEGLEGDLELSTGSLSAHIKMASLEVASRETGTAPLAESLPAGAPPARAPLRSVFEASTLEVSAVEGTTRAVFQAQRLLLPSPAGPQTLAGAQVELDLTPAGGSHGEDDLAMAVAVTLEGKSLGGFEGILGPGPSATGTSNAGPGPSPPATGSLVARNLEGSLDGMPLALLFPWLPPAGAWSGEGLVDLALEPGDEGGTRYRLALDAPRLEFGGAAGRLRIRDLRAEVTGELDLARLAPSSPVRGEVRLASLAGAWEDQPVPPSLFPLEARFELTLPEGLQQLPAGPLRLPEGTVTLVAGKLGRLELELPPVPPEGRSTVRWRWPGATVREILEVAAQAGISLPQDLVLEGRLRGQGTVGWPGALPTAESLRAQGTLSFEGGHGAGGVPVAWDLTQVDTAISWSWRSGRLQAEVEDLGGQLTVAQLAPLPVQGKVRVAIETQRTGSGRGLGRLKLDRLELASPDLLALTAEGSLQDGKGEGRMHFEGVKLSPWREVLRPLTGELAPGVTLSGAASGDLNATFEGDTWSLSGPLRVEGSGFASADGSHVLEGLSSEWQILLHSGRQSAVGPGSVAQLQAQAKVGGFQILLGTFFADVSGLETELSLDASLLNPEQGRSQGEIRTGLRWQLEDGAAITAGLVLEPAEEQAGGQGEPAESAFGAVHGTVDVVLEDLEGLLDRHLRAPLLDASDAFESLKAQGGIELRFEGSRGEDGALEVEGQLVAHDLSLSGLGPAYLRDLRLDLPFHLVQAPGETWKAGKTTDGSMRFRGFEVAGLALEAAEAPLAISGDSVALRRPLVLPVAGGRLVFEDLSLVDLLASSRHLETALEVDGLELERLTASLGTLPLEGKIDGRLPRIRLDGSSLGVDGGGEVQVFGGTVAVGDISGQDVLSRYPKVVFSAEFRELNLGHITRRFDIGEMNGVLQGSLSDCELFRSVLVRCSGHFETVERPGIKRTISVKAVNNIAILGTGQGAGFLDRGITRFFDRFTYARLGIEMSLSQDVFLLRGLEERRGKELFLKGRLPFPIDVVNAQPGRTVSFQTMVRRLQSLDFSKAVTKP